MCGIAGVINFNKERVNKQKFSHMLNLIKHRGPDAEGQWFRLNTALGHRRLSILDLTSAANQPMGTEDERYHIIFNGEVYNFLEIKKLLLNKGIAFRTTSDTEVVLKAYSIFGENCFAMFNGMFALAIHDANTNELVIARDSFGIKPLYYYKSHDVFVFASEMKSIKAYLGLMLNLNENALAEYLWYGNPLGDKTFYKEIEELTPGTSMIIKEGLVEQKKFFSINAIKEQQIDEVDSIEKVRYLLEASVKRHLVSDVPVGVLLSGGIDSSALTAFASRHYKGKLSTFSIGFDFNAAQNELPLAKKVAKYFGTDHHEIHISGSDTEHAILSLVEHHDEPFGDAADIPLFLISKELKGKIKVVLQGDGGDEFFGGYSRYNTVFNAKHWKLLSFLIPLIKLSGTQNTKILQFQRFLDAISQKHPYMRNALLLTMESRFTDPLRVLNPKILDVIRKVNPFDRYKEVYSGIDSAIDDVQALFFADPQIILKDTFFPKVDKSTMANSLEVRVPFLDKDLTEFMLTVPANLKVKNGQQKFLIKKALEGFIPDEVIYGKKRGFGVPYSSWLKTSLKSSFLENISTEIASNYLNLQEILKLFEIHFQGKGNYGFLLWKVYVLAIWLNSVKNRKNFTIV